MARNASAAPVADNDYLAGHAQLLIASFRRLTGRDLVSPSAQLAEQARMLFEAPFVVASHGTGADPVFNYGNRATLALFETTWAEFIAMPSRLSAEPVAQEERAKLLARVSEAGFIDDYQGVRVSRTGRRFLIERATVWNVVDASDVYRGQAVTFRDWRYL
jgi:hypothetical protein